MRLHVVGSSGTFPTPTNPASGYLVECDGTRVWCDAGPGTFTRLPVGGDLIDAVFISHRHPDHCTDILTAYHAWTFRPEPRSGIPLIANGDVLDHLAAFIGRSRAEAFGETFDLREVGGGDSTTIGALEVSFVEMNHSAPDLGTRWTGNGRVLFFTGDTGPGPWETEVAGADMLLCEAALAGVRAPDESVLHMTPFDAGRVAREQDVGSLMLTHIPPYLDAAESVADAESVFDRPVRLATPGTVHKV